MSDSRAPASLSPYSDTSTAGQLAVVRVRPLHPVVFVVVGGSLSLLPALIGVGMLSLGITVAVVATIAMIVLWLVVRPRQVPPLPEA
ncbi:MAG: hypothetical protein ABWY57_03700 [Mycetocola sp.]